MRLDIQIYSFIVSFLFGCIFYILLELFNRLVVKVGMLFKVILSFLFIMVMASLYFLILLFVNNGVVHIYFLLMILVGYIFSHFLTFWLFTHLRKK